MINKKILHVVTIVFGILCVIGTGCISSNSGLKRLDEPLIPTEAAENIQSKLGYVLAPSYLPNDVQFEGIRLGSDQHHPEATISYTDVSDSKVLFICYPYNFQLDAFYYLPPYVLNHPDDYMRDFVINGMSAQLYRGMWTMETIRKIQGARFNKEAIIEGEWDYTLSLTLGFEYKIDDEVITIVIQAEPNSSEWITEETLISVAESLVEVKPILE